MKRGDRSRASLWAGLWQQSFWLLVSQDPGECGWGTLSPRRTSRTSRGQQESLLLTNTSSTHNMLLLMWRPHLGLPISAAVSAPGPLSHPLSLCSPPGPACVTRQALGTVAMRGELGLSLFLQSRSPERAAPAPPAASRNPQVLLLELSLAPGGREAPCPCSPCLRSELGLRSLEV